MLKYCKALVNIAIAVLVFLAVCFLVPRILIFFAPFVIGWIIALIAGPFVRFFEEKIKLKRKAGSAFVIIVIIGLVVLMLYLVGSKLVEELVGLVNSLPEIWQSAEEDFREIGDNLSVIYSRLPEDLQDTLTGFWDQIGNYMGELFGRAGSPTIASVGNFAKQLPTILIGLIMALLSSYFFVAERNLIGEWFRRYTPNFIQVRYRMLKR